MTETKPQTSLLRSDVREYFIISQALYLAVKVLEEVEGVEREVSNILDMHTLIDNKYPIYKEIKSMEENQESFVLTLKKKDQDVGNEN